MTSRSSPAAPILAVLAVVLVTLGAYVGGYFWLGNYITNPARTRIFRSYRFKWERDLFKPAARIEGMIRGVRVETGILPSA